MANSDLPTLFTPVSLHVGDDYIDLYGVNPSSKHDGDLDPRMLRFTGHPDDSDTMRFATAVEKALNSHEELITVIVNALKAIAIYPEKAHPMTASEAMLKMALISAVGKNAALRLLHSI